MLIALIARDKPGALQTRLDNRDAHVAYIKNSGVVAQAGPLLDEDGEMCGSLVMLEVADMAAAEGWAANDPYAKAGLFETVELIQWNKVIGRALLAVQVRTLDLGLGRSGRQAATRARNGTACATTRPATSCARWPSATAGSSTTRQTREGGRRHRRGQRRGASRQHHGRSALGMRRHPRGAAAAQGR